MRPRRAVPQIPAKSSAPPRLPFYNSRHSLTRSESTLTQLLIPLHFIPFISNTYKKPGGGPPLPAPKFCNSLLPSLRPRSLATRQSSLVTLPATPFPVHPELRRAALSPREEPRGTGHSQLAEDAGTSNPASASVDAASSISPLSATLTKNTGGWGIPSFSANSVQWSVVLCRVILLKMTASQLQRSNVERSNMNRRPRDLARATGHGSRITNHEFKMIRWLSHLMTTHVPVLIVGAGISGLALTYYLRKSGIDAQLLESSPRPGGVIRSERRDGFLLELGPQSFSGTSQLLDLSRELGIENELLEAPPSAPRFLFLGGQLKPAPLSPPAFFASSLFSARTKWSILRDLFGRSAPPDADETVAAFIRRKFSAELLDKLVGPFVSGIHAGDPEKLSLRAAFPQLHEAERSAGSVIRGMMRAAKSKPGPKQHPTLQTFRDGNETLIKSLAKNLGSALRCGVEVTAIQQGGAGIPQSGERFVVETIAVHGNETIIADRLVLALPAYVAAKLLRPELASPLGEIRYAPVAVISLGYQKKDLGHSLEGFGFLIPRSEGLRTLGTVWNSSLFPCRVPEGYVLLTSFVGGATDPEAAALSAEELCAMVHREIAPILSIRGLPAFWNVQSYQRALPQYDLGHNARMAALARESCFLLNLKLVGNYLRGPAIGACIE